MENTYNPQLSKMAIDLGSLGSVEVVKIEETLVEVFAKLQGSPYATGGSDFSDDTISVEPTQYYSI
jgi:hypothetical protein